jgi:hypothetical protein
VPTRWFSLTATILTLFIYAAAALSKACKAPATKSGYLAAAADV